MKKTNKETIFGKGITMSMEELKELSNMLNIFFNEKERNV